MRIPVKLQKQLDFLRQHQERITFHLAWLLPFLLYFISLPPGVTWGDSPELTNAAMTFGVAHPSGYPLFLILGKLFSLLPFEEPAFGLNLMDALLESGAMLWIYLSIRYLTKKPWIALLAALFVAVTYTIWMHGRIAEVYALNNFFIGAILYFMFRWIEERKLKHLYIMSLFFGLAFTNHLTTVLFFPAVLFLFLSTDPKRLFHPRVLLPLVGIILLFQLLYLYLPLATSAAEGKTIAWNHPSSLSRFLYHVTGEEYSVFRKSSSLGKGLNQFWLTFQKEFGIIGGFLCILGLMELLAKSWRTGLTLALYFASTVVYNSTYVVQDITSYYMAPYMASGIALGVGAAWLHEARKQSEHLKWLMTYAVPIVMVIGIVQLYGKNWDLKYRDNMAHYFGHQAFSALPEHSLLLTDIDGPSFAMWYQAFALHPEQRGKVVVTKGMFFDKYKAWYRDFLRKRYTQINWPKEGGAYGNAIVQKLVDLNYGKIPIYTAFYYRVPLKGYSYVNRGWITEIVKKEDEKGPIKANQNLRWSYLTTVKFAKRNEWYVGSPSTFHLGEILGCVAEWINKHKGVTTTWHIVDPSGRVVEKFSRFVPRSEPISAFKMRVSHKHLLPGTFTCRITFNGKLGASLPFTVEQ